MHAQTLSKRQIWFMILRPKTLPAAIGPVLSGSAFAVRDHMFDLIIASFALLFALLLQIASNIANDYFDALHGIDLPERVGPLRVTASGLMSPAQVRRALLMVFSSIFVVWLFLIYFGGWPLVIIGLLAGFFAVAYSGGPIPLGSKALGDLLVFIFFGLVAVTTTYYLQTKTLTSQVFIAAVPIGLFIMAILIINNYRDYESDKKAGKITLAVLLGKQVTKLYFIVVILAGYMVAFILYVNILLIDLNLVILPLLTLPIHIFIIKELFRSEGKALNKLLALTARTSLLYSIFFSIGLLI